MKINWGTSIVIVFVLFAAMLTYYMVKGSRNQADLVAEDYYEQEIRYQDRIDHKANANQLDPLTTKREGLNYIITFPVDAPLADSDGNIHFYRPNDASLDFEIPIEVSENREQIIRVQDLAKGMWVVKIQLNTPEKNYYWERKLRL